MVDRAPINLGEIDIVCVDELQYVSSSIPHCCCPSDGVHAASSASGTLQKPVFSGHYLDIHIERCVCVQCLYPIFINIWFGMLDPAAV